MAYPNITKSENTIHNPNEPRHWMRIMPIDRNVEVFYQKTLIAKTNSALRVVEVSKDVLEPAIYIPEQDLVSELNLMAERTTHCPIKGDAIYFAFPGQGDAIAWSYPDTLGLAEQLTKRVAFYRNLVTIVEHAK